MFMCIHTIYHVYVHPYYLPCLFASLLFTMFMCIHTIYHVYVHTYYLPCLCASILFNCLTEIRIENESPLHCIDIYGDHCTLVSLVIRIYFLGAVQLYSCTVVHNEDSFSRFPSHTPRNIFFSCSIQYSSNLSSS